MTREDRMKAVNGYFDIEDFCRRVVEEYALYPILAIEAYHNFESFHLYDDWISIKTSETFRGEIDYSYISIPVDVYYNNTLKGYVKKVSEDKEKEAAKEQKQRDEDAKEWAKQTIAKLKEKYNL